jgi:thiamine-monophosphate kinase
VGGDTTKGALSITINATGVIAKNQALMRSGAQVGDIVFVSNTLGDAGLAWHHLQSGKTPSTTLLEKFNRPEPQIKLGQALLGVASSCIDISDGLEQDLSHILSSSEVGAVIDIQVLPLSKEVSQYIVQTQDWCIALSGGDDYELCFTVPKVQINDIRSIEKSLSITLTQIGIITSKQGLKVKGLKQDCQSYQHF